VTAELDKVSPRMKADARQVAHYRKVLTHDLMALESVAQEIEKNKTAGKRFAAAFLPQIGHAPWFDIHGNDGNYLSRGRAVMALQDRWLGRLLKQMRRNGWLDNTIIVVTSDHGIRTRTEDPQFNGGMISDYSFAVPLLIFSPNALNSEKRIPWVTSHIDITPSILDLIGIKADRGFEQGGALWDPRLVGRKTFFHAKGYLGADGYHENGYYYMTNHLLGSVYRNKKFSFSVDHLIPPDNSRHSSIRGTIEEMRHFQVRWRTLKNK